MHSYSDSLDSAVNIWTNPLNIHMDDGSDLIIGNPSPSQFVSTSKPELVHRKSSPQPHEAESMYAHEAANVSRHSIHEPVQPLNLGCKKKDDTSSVTASKDKIPAGSDKPVAESDRPSTIAELSIPEFSPLVSMDFESFALNRQNTIKSQGAPLEARPSTNIALFQRIRSMRTHQPDPIVDEPLPANLLKVIQFSPNPNPEWPENAYSDTETASVMAPSPAMLQSSPAISDKTAVSVETLPHDLSLSNLKPDKLDEKSTSCPNTVEIPQLAEIAGLCEIGGETEGSTDFPAETLAEHASTTASPKVSPNILAPSNEPEVAQTPDIAGTDPISENDRGRLFMQIRKLESLRGIPIDLSRNPRFTITLDNGLQTVTTPAVPLPSNKFNGSIHASICQEFELTVGRDLELVMTLNLLMDGIQPPPKPRSLGTRGQTSSVGSQAVTEPTTPTTPKHSRVKSFFSPKRKQKQQKEAVQQQQIKNQDDYIQIEKEHDAQMIEYRKRRDMWKGLTGPAGEYARGYLFESHYERDIYGKAEVYSLPLYNEWQGQESQHMGDLQLTLMFIPRLYGSEKLPASISQAQKLIKEAQVDRQYNCAGYLTQNGGDCRMYRRRYFTLNGSEFVAHHEASHKVRAVIHMENALDVVDSDNVTPNDNMWCIYEDRSFLLVFADGEEVSFYADTPELKNQWVQALAKSMNFASGRSQTWQDIVLDSFEAK